MSKLPHPVDTWSPKEQFIFFRAIEGRLVWGTFTWDAPNVPAASTVDTALTVSTSAHFDNLLAGMVVVLTPPPGLDAGLVCSGLVASHKELRVRIGNLTAVDINAVSGTWAFLAWNAS